MRRPVLLLLVCSAAGAALLAAALPGCGNHCDKQSDCAGGQVCYQSSCVAAGAARACTTDSDCGKDGDFYCFAGMCNLRGEPPPNVPDSGPVTDAGTSPSPDSGTVDSGTGGADAGPADSGVPPAVDPCATSTQSAAVHGFTEMGIPPGAGSINSIWASCPRDAWSAGAQILHWNGQQWSVVSTPAPVGSTFNRVWGSGFNDVWFVGLGGLVFHWDGDSLKNFTLPSRTDLYDVFGFGPNDVHFVGARASYFHTSTPGTPLSRPMAAETRRDLLAIWGSSPQDLWIGGGEGGVAGNAVMLHSTDDGASWSKVSGADTFNFPIGRIAGTGPSNVYMLGLAGETLQTTSPQLTPTQPLGSPNADLDIWFASSTLGYLANGSLNQVDGQGTWTTIQVGPRGANISVHAVGGSGPHDVWVGTNDGRIFHGP